MLQGDVSVLDYTPVFFLLFLVKLFIRRALIWALNA